MTQSDINGMHPTDVISSAIAKADLENQMLWITGLASIRESSTYAYWYPVVVDGLIHSKIISESGLLSVISVIPASNMAASLDTLEAMLTIAIEQQHSLESLQEMIDSFWNTHPKTLFERMAGFLPRLQAWQSAAQYRHEVFNICELLEADCATGH